jgi:hypothetical protein
MPKKMEASEEWLVPHQAQPQFNKIKKQPRIYKDTGLFYFSKQLCPRKPFLEIIQPEPN